MVIFSSTVPSFVFFVAATYTKLFPNDSAMQCMHHLMPQPFICLVEAKMLCLPLILRSALNSHKLVFNISLMNTVHYSANFLHEWSCYLPSVTYKLIYKPKSTFVV